MAMELPKSLDIFGLFWMFNEMYFSAILPQRISWYAKPHGILILHLDLKKD